MQLPRVNKDVLPILGILAFSGCSVNALANLFFGAAQHDNPLFWAAAGLVELCTAWLVWSIVETMRKLTKSNISNQDRRFHSFILTFFIVLAIPSLSVSVVANVREFDGNLLLGCLFPIMSIACAVGAGLPGTVRKREAEKVKEAEVVRKGREAKRKEKAKAAEAKRKELEAKKEWEAKLMGLCDNALEILRAYAANPVQSKSAVGKELGIDRKLVGYHLERLDSQELVQREDGQVHVLVPSEFLEG